MWDIEGKISLLPSERLNILLIILDTLYSMISALENFSIYVRL